MQSLLPLWCQIASKNSDLSQHRKKTSSANDAEGYKTVNYSELPLLTLQAVKELKAETDTLKQKLSEQQRLLTEQQQEIATIKQRLCSAQPQANFCKAKAGK